MAGIGCSIIGLGIGAAIDQSSPATKTIEDREIEKIRRGTLTTAYLWDGSQITGAFGGLVNVSEAEYAKSYSLLRAKHRDSLPLPAIGESIVIDCRWQKKSSYEFCGFDYQYKRLRRTMSLRKKHFPSEQNIYLSAKSKIANIHQKFYLGDLRKITDSHGNIMKGRQLRDFAVEGKIPLRSAVSLKTLNSKSLVSIDRIRTLEGPRIKNVKMMYFFFGLVIDIAAIVFWSTADFQVINFGD
jgi:hypothetical protein